MKLIAFLKRREGTSREEFLDHWHLTHGPLVSDTPGLGGRLLRYEQYPLHPNDGSGFDGVAVQEFAGWSDFAAMLADPAAEVMHEDERQFLDMESIRFVFVDDPVVVVGDGTAREPGG